MLRRQQGTSVGDAVTALHARTTRKITLRIIPFLFVCYITAWFDRVNVGFAALQMNQDLGFSPTQFGFGSGVFFVGYCLFEVPSNLILARVGARIWLARIMITWGILASVMMFIRSPASFYVLRLLLGVAEAGFFPGVIFYMSQWFFESDRARAIGIFMAGIPISGAIGGPWSGALLGLNGYLGLAGWQWLYLIEGIPPILLGIVLLFYLTDRPEQAKWLDEDEREDIIATLRAERIARANNADPTPARALLNVTVWQLGIVLLLANIAFHGYLIWGPQLIKSMIHTTDARVGVVIGVIGFVMATVVVLSAMHSDRTGERRLHVAIPLVVMACGLTGCAVLSSPAFSLLALSLVPLGMGAIFGPFWALPTTFLRGTAAAAGLAMVASVGNVGGFLGPVVIGLLKDRTGSYHESFVLLAMLALVASALAFGIRRESRAMSVVKKA